MRKNSKPHEWVAGVPISKIEFNTANLNRDDYEYIKGFDNSYFYESHTLKAARQRAKEYGVKYFSYYLREKNHKTGRDALVYAIMNWRNARCYDEILRAVKLIHVNDDVWVKMYDDILYTAGIKAKEKKNELLEFCIDLEKKVTRPKVKSKINYDLGYYYYFLGNKENALKHFNKIIRINAVDFEVNRSRVIIHELKYLNIGQQAPEFGLTGLKGTRIVLSKLRGKYVLVHIWNPGCGFSRAEFRYLRKAYKKFKDKNLAMIGVCTGEDIDRMWGTIKKEKLAWPQVFINIYEKGKIKYPKDGFVSLYNATAYPRSYLVDPKGIIIAKDMRRDELLKTLKKYLEQDR